MSKELLQRNYYKIFTGTNQNDGYDKVYLGYEGYTSEIVLKRDRVTYFHIPFFAQTQPLNDSALVANGAIPGAIPALADRIFKKQGGYGSSTPFGNTQQIRDGTWLCSWLYALSGETPIWLDRYYNPGHLSVKEAFEQGTNILNYVPNDPVWYDIPSEMTLDPGVWYQYFHQGENTNSEIVTTFGGVSGTRLRLCIEDWSAISLDKSIYKNNIFINNFKPEWVISFFETGYLDRNVLNFDNSSFIDCRALYNTSYNLEDEFSLSMWVYNKQWSTATGTQLVGNLRNGGYGVWYDNLKTYPYYAIPETRYGHLFLINQGSNVYQQKNIQLTNDIFVKPVFLGINSEFETIVVDENSKKVYKYNHLGDVLGQSKTLNGGFYTMVGIPQNAIIGGDNSVTVTTTSGTYIFNSDLVVTTVLSGQPSLYETLAYNMSGNLIIEPNSLDVKFDNYNNKWVIKTDYKLYCNGLLQNIPANFVKNIAIDPENVLWILADTNDIFKYDTFNKKIISQFKVGLSQADLEPKQISFINEYNREKGTLIWYAIIIDEQEQNLYQITLDGDIRKVINLSTYLNTRDPLSQNQDPKTLKFGCKGDFTGYEWKRIFHKALYNNKHQIHFKVAIDSPYLGFLPSRLKLSVPVDFFVDKTWYLLTCTFKNKQMQFYINNKLIATKEIPFDYKLTYIYKNDLYIGTPCGKTDNFNNELNYNTIIWNGYIDSVRIYDYALQYNNLQPLLREKIQGKDIVWDVRTAPLQYIETIERFFKHKLPGHKSPFYNIKLSGLKIKDQSLRAQIEAEIRNVVTQISPAYTKLLKIEWID
jgi:hypothetical protein